MVVAFIRPCNHFCVPDRILRFGADKDESSILLRRRVSQFPGDRLFGRDDVLRFVVWQYHGRGGQDDLLRGPGEGGREQSRIVRVNEGSDGNPRGNRECESERQDLFVHLSSPLTPIVPA